LLVKLTVILFFTRVLPSITTIASITFLCLPQFRKKPILHFTKTCWNFLGIFPSKVFSFCWCFSLQGIERRWMSRTRKRNESELHYSYICETVLWYNFIRASVRNEFFFSPNLSENLTIYLPFVMHLTFHILRSFVGHWKQINKLFQPLGKLLTLNTVGTNKPRNNSISVTRARRFLRSQMEERHPLF